MPVKGYKAITVSSTLYEQLKIKAEDEGLSLADLITRMYNQLPMYTKKLQTRYTGVQIPTLAPW
jgi:predicted CopG family antitoxin